MIHPLVQARLPELTPICRRFGVRRLDLFGSAAEGRFATEYSDLDFLVEFDPSLHSGHANRYFGLLAELEDLFARPVDLVEAGAVRNPYFRRRVEQSRTLLYAA